MRERYEVLQQQKDGTWYGRGIVNAHSGDEAIKTVKRYTMKRAGEWKARKAKVTKS